MSITVTPLIRITWGDAESVEMTIEDAHSLYERLGQALYPQAKTQLAETTSYAIELHEGDQPAIPAARVGLQEWEQRLLDVWERSGARHNLVGGRRISWIMSTLQHSRFPELRGMSADDCRSKLRSLGVNVPAPIRARHTGSVARAAKAAKPQSTPTPTPEPAPSEECSPPRPISGHEPQVTMQLIHVLAERGDGPVSWVWIRAGLADVGYPATKLTQAEVEQFERSHGRWLDDYRALPPFKRREIDQQLLADWQQAVEDRR